MVYEDEYDYEPKLTLGCILIAVFYVLFFVYCVSSDVQHYCRLLVDHKLVKAPPPSNFIAGRPKAALLFWFFGGFRCGVPLLIVVFAIY